MGFHIEKAHDSFQPLLLKEISSWKYQWEGQVEIAWEKWSISFLHFIFFSVSNTRYSAMQKQRICHWKFTNTNRSISLWGRILKTFSFFILSKHFLWMSHTMFLYCTPDQKYPAAIENCFSFRKGRRHFDWCLTGINPCHSSIQNSEK